MNIAHYHETQPKSDYAANDSWMSLHVHKSTIVREIIEKHSFWMSQNALTKAPNTVGEKIGNKVSWIFSLPW